MSSTTTQLSNFNSTVFLQESSTISYISSDLVLRPYSDTNSGFYWCEIIEILNPPQLVDSFPSQVIQVEAPFTADQLQTCSDPITLIIVRRAGVQLVLTPHHYSPS